MQDSMFTLLLCSATMSALALFYMALTPLLTKRYSEKGRYYAWLVIVIGLIIPFRPQFQNAVIKVDAPDITTAPFIQAGAGMNLIAPAEPATAKNAELPPAPLSISLWQAVEVIWLGGVIAFLVYHIIKHYRFIKMANRWSETINDEFTLTLLQALKTEMGISKHISLYLSPCVGSPMLIGFIKPRILLVDLAQDELHLILKHELVHYKRKDLWYKYLVLIANALHWFNPIVYLITKAINMQCELSCDAETVRGSDINTRQHYSETIIGVVKYQSTLKTALSTNFYGGKKGMKKRIFSIMDMSKKRVGFMITCCAVIAVFATGMIFAVNADGATKKTETQNNDEIILYTAPGAENNHSSYTDEDYATLMALKTNDYRELSVNEFDSRVENIQMIYSGYNPNDENVDFMKTLMYSTMESLYSFNNETPMLSVGIGINKQTDNDEYYGAGLNYEIHWSITNKNKTTVGERDDILNTCQNSVQSILENKNHNELQNKNITASLQSEYDSLAKQLSNDSISLRIAVESFEAYSNEYAVYNQYGLTYNTDENRLYYEGEIVRYFVDKYNNGQGYAYYWDYDPNGTIDLYAVRDETGIQGNLVGIKAYSQEDFDLRTLEFIARENNIPNYDILTYRFKKEDAPDSLLLWIQKCESDVFDFCVTEQDGRYYIYVRGDKEFGFNIETDNGNTTAYMKIYDIDSVQGEGYALFSVPLYERFTVTYNNQTKSSLQSPLDFK